MYKEDCSELLPRSCILRNGIANNLAGKNGQCSMLWIGLVHHDVSWRDGIRPRRSFINKLAPAEFTGLLLGTWPVAVFFSQFIILRSTLGL